MKRYEWEKEIPFDEALELLMLCENTIIHKQRYEIMFEGNSFEVDEFFGENEGLTVAELELKTMDSIYTLPEWIGEEITGDTRYYNSQLCVNPFSFWK
jgi:adenylate cyclase